MKNKILFLVFIFLILLTSQTFASSIILDGDFSDWFDKPYFDPKDNNPDDISGLKQIYWFYDNTDNNLYFRVHIDKSKKKDKIQTIFKSDFGDFNAITNYDTSDNIVTVTLEGNKNKELWTSSTKSCLLDENDNSINIEFMIPINYLVKDMQMGYLINFRFIGGFGDAPKNSWFTISTISTYPYLGIAACVIVIASLTFTKKISRKKT